VPLVQVSLLGSGFKLVVYAFVEAHPPILLYRPSCWYWSELAPSAAVVTTLHLKIRACYFLALISTTGAFTMWFPKYVRKVFDEMFVRA
jgi:hypothetical protein